jgi:hypothetical protein
MYSINRRNARKKELLEIRPNFIPPQSRGERGARTGREAEDVEESGNTVQDGGSRDTPSPLAGPVNPLGPNVYGPFMSFYP